ncbi:MAG: hypothetical protein ACI4FN_07740 [Acutalibacteraceae bacterium]
MKTGKKDLIKVIAVAAAGVIAGTGVTAAAFGTANKTEDTENTSAASSQAAETTEQKKPSKDETVYVLANADGSVKKIIVSDWIKNNGGKTVSDKTELSDIKNVKGDESYVMDTDNMREWNADGKDIYYQGTISKALPVDLKVSYELDGKPVSAESLGGKSGKVTIRFDYTNNQYKNVSIDGKNTKIYVPFVMLTGLLLDNDIFTNVEISNGKIINDGDRIIAVGFALPGMKENLNLSRDKVDIPDFVEITADVKNFALGNTLTVAANSIISDLDVSKLDSADDLQASLTELSSAMSKLLDGSSELYGGLSELLLKSNELVAGVDKLANGASALSDGTAALSAGLSELVSNNDTLNTGAKQVFDTLLSTVSQKLKDNGITVDTLTVENYKTVLGGLLENPTDSQKAQLINIADTTLNAKLSAIGVPQDYYGAVKVLLATKLSSGETQENAMAQIAAMLQNISDPQNAASIGAAAATAESENGKQIINALCLNLSKQTLEPTVKEAVTQLDSYNEFYKGVLAYTAGAKQAYDGSTELKNGAKELSDGANALKSGSSQLVGGVQQLTDGSKRLADGLKEFNEKGISKLTSLAGDDLGSLVTRIKATVEVSRDYKSFAGIADGTDGDVKFIYRTDEIK